MLIWSGSITDDTGLMAVIDAAAYKTFIDEDWELEKLYDHFSDEMAQRHLLIWGTGCENEWKVRIELEAETTPTGYRELKGFMAVSDGSLLLINYESLTSAAQFADVILPEEPLAYCRFELPSAT